MALVEPCPWPCIQWVREVMVNILISKRSLYPSPPHLPLPYPTGLAEKLLELFQKTALGSFLAQFTVDQQQELLHCYLKDFLLLTMRVSTWEQLNVSTDSRSGQGWHKWTKYRHGACSTAGAAMSVEQNVAQEESGVRKCHSHLQNPWGWMVNPPLSTPKTRSF